MDSSTTVPITTRKKHHKEHAIERSSTMLKSSNSKGGWHAAIFIIFVEMAERFAFFGLAGNMVSFLTNVFHESNVTAAKNVNTWVGVSFIFPLIGAFIADSYLGRFRTILFSSIIYFMGMILLTLSVSVVPLHYRKVVFFTALYTLAIGEGGHKPCVQTFAADQFDENTPEEIKAKSSFFNWWSLGIVTVATCAILLVIYLQRYRKQGPSRSPFTRVAQVFVSAAKKRRMGKIRNGKGVWSGEKMMVTSLLGTNQFRFLDKAMIMDDIDASSEVKNTWRLCSLDQVEEVKQVLRLIPIWLSCLFFNVAQSQPHTFFTKQASTMVRTIGPKFHLPAASLQALIGLTIMTTIPIYDQVFVPTVRKFTRIPTGITMLQRIGFGLFLSILNMVVSALVEAKRVGVAKEHNLLENHNAVVPIRVWWLLPQYFICGMVDVFTLVGLQQFFYDQMPAVMRSVGAAAYISIIGAGSFISSAVISIVEAVTKGKWLEDNLNRSHLDCFYWLLAGLSALNLCVFVAIAKQYGYRKVEQKDGAGEDKEMSLGVYQS